MWRCLLSLIMATPLLAQQIAVQEPGTILRVPSAETESLLDTLERVADLRKAGDRGPVTVELPSGEYLFAETLQLTADVVGDGLTLKPAEARPVVWSGTRPLKGGTRDANGHWRISLPADWQQFGTPRLLLVDGALRSPARYPNDGYLRIERALEDRRSGFVIPEGELPPTLDLKQATCDLILLHDWSSSRLPVRSVDRESRVLRTVGPIGCSAPHYAIDHFEKQPRYWLEGHAAFADTPGEWYVDREAEELVIIGGEGESEAPQVALPWLTEILVVGNLETPPVKGFSLQGITFTGTRFPMPPGGLAGAQATMHEPRDAQGTRTTSNRPMLAAAVRIENATNCQIARCRFTELGGTGLWIAGLTKECQVTRCRFDSMGGNGLNIGEDNSRRVNGQAWYQSAPDQVPAGHRVEQCEISHCGRMLPGAVAIWAPLNHRLSIVDNHIHDCPYTGISLGWIWNPSPSPAGENRIAGNRIEFVMQVLSDGGGIYTLGRQPDSIIEQNHITDVPLNAGRAESNGMFLDEGTTGFTIRENTIRRIDRSPLRFHRAGENVVINNRWELATPETPPVRFNNTPEENISIESNEVLEPEQRIFLIGNSLTWDTIPARLDGNVHWHVDCGKSLPYIFAHPQSPCVGTSRLWPKALQTAQYDFISVQPHYGSTLEADVDVISHWVDAQPRAVFVIHTGWPRHASLAEERADSSGTGRMSHSTAYFEALLTSLREKHPGRQFRITRAMELVHRIADDIKADRAPFTSIEELYRDAIHMTNTAGRYLMHNTIREALDQPPTAAGFPDLDPVVKRYLDGLLAETSPD